MVTSNRLSSIATCPPKTEGWTPLSGIPAAILNDDAPKILAKGYPQGLCQKTDAGSKTASYFVKSDETTLAFVNLLLTPRPSSKLEAPPMGDEKKNVALALVTVRRHPEPGAAVQMSVFEKDLPPMVDSELAGTDWLILDVNLTPSLVTLIRYEMNDSDNDLFRRAARGVSYYITADTEKISRMMSVLHEIKRDCSAVEQQELAGDVNQIAIQLNYVREHLQITQPFWDKPIRELWPMAVVGTIAVVAGGWGFAEGMELAHARKHLFAKVADWIRNNRKPPSAGAGGAGASGGAACTDGGSSDLAFSTIEDRVDSGEAADFQIDPTRTYDRLHHLHINGTAVAAVVVAGGVMLLMPYIIPYVAAASPEAVSLATGVGAFAATH